MLSLFFLSFFLLFYPSLMSLILLFLRSYSKCCLFVSDGSQHFSPSVLFFSSCLLLSFVLLSPLLFLLVFCLVLPSVWSSISPSSLSASLFGLLLPISSFSYLCTLLLLLLFHPLLVSASPLFSSLVFLFVLGLFLCLFLLLDLLSFSTLFLPISLCPPSLLSLYFFVLLLSLLDLSDHPYSSPSLSVWIFYSYSILSSLRLFSHFSAFLGPGLLFCWLIPPSFSSLILVSSLLFHLFVSSLTSPFLISYLLLSLLSPSFPSLSPLPPLSSLFASPTSYYHSYSTSTCLTLLLIRFSLSSLPFSYLIFHPLSLRSFYAPFVCLSFFISLLIFYSLLSSSLLLLCFSRVSFFFHFSLECLPYSSLHNSSFCIHWNSYYYISFLTSVTLLLLTLVYFHFLFSFSYYFLFIFSSILADSPDLSSVNSIISSYPSSDLFFSASSITLVCFCIWLELHELYFLPLNSICALLSALMWFLSPSLCSSTLRSIFPLFSYSWSVSNDVWVILRYIWHTVLHVTSSLFLIPTFLRRG